jgi:hypothetical protein
MYTFILSTIIVTIISLCVFKNRFWENRIIILLIIAIVSFLTTTTLGFILRKTLPIKTEVISSEVLNELTTCDSISVVTSIPKVSDFIKQHEDSCVIVKSHSILFTYKKNQRIGWIPDTTKLKNEIHYVYVKNSYFRVCNDNPRIEKILITHDTSKNKWITDLTLPSIRTIFIIYLPQDEYDLLSDEHKRKTHY